MNYRFDTRTIMRMAVELRLNHSSLGIFQTRDIDSMGVFIEGPQTELRLQDVVDMHFVFEQTGVPGCTQRGVVARCADDGVAVVFVADNAVLLQTLGAMVFDGYPPEYRTLAS